MTPHRMPPPPTYAELMPALDRYCDAAHEALADAERKYQRLKATNQPHEADFDLENWKKLTPATQARRRAWYTVQARSAEYHREMENRKFWRRILAHDQSLTNKPITQGPWLPREQSPDYATTAATILEETVTP